MYRDIMKYMWKSFIGSDHRIEVYQGDINDYASDLPNDDTSESTQENCAHLLPRAGYSNKIHTCYPNTLS